MGLLLDPSASAYQPGVRLPQKKTGQIWPAVLEERTCLGWGMVDYASAASASKASR